MGDPLLHIKPMAEGDSLKERFKHHRKAAKSQSNTTHQSINDFIRFTKNNTQTAVMNITDKRIVRKKIDLLLDVSYASTYIFRSNRYGKTTKFKFENQ